MTQDTTEIFNEGVDPVHSGIYLVDRGPKLGRPVRYYNADSKVWSRACYTMEELMEAKDAPSALGKLPWRGPFSPTDKVEIVQNVVGLEKSPAKAVATPKPAKAPRVKVDPVAKQAAKDAKKAASVQAKAAKAAEKAAAKQAKATTEPVARKRGPKHPDGTIFFREDKQYWVAYWGGIQEAHRPDAERCAKFLEKKYGFTAVTVYPQGTVPAEPTA